MMREATLLDLLQAEAKSLYQQFNTTMTLIKDASDPKVRSMWVDDLHELHSRAQKLLDTGQLNHQTQPLMRIVASRPCEQWVVLAKNVSSPVVTLW
jgi:hypothetical protein